VIVAVAVTDAGRIAPGWGRAHRVAVASTSDGVVTDWTEFEVGWDLSRDTETDGAHHARVARFLLEHRVQAVVADHLGAGMSRMLHTMGINASLGSSGDARGAAQAAARQLA
jgi:predicted Fe-Mo cluster-binding NifX family protein